MAAPSPSLSISDIMHPLSPPPVSVLQKSSSPPPRPRSITPEPLEPAEIEDMRRKVMSMGWGDSSKGKDRVGTREQELADMLLRLTHPASLPQPSQLHAQAETIAHLIQQRDFLVKRSLEEHERWESEREGWARAAQALIVQGRRQFVQLEKDEATATQYTLVTADPATARMLEFERANAALQIEKKTIQQKLNDTQARLASLESELAQLKPLLLMQPFALTHSHPTSITRGHFTVLPSTPSAAASRREKEREIQREREQRGQDTGMEPEDEVEPDVEPPQQLQSRFQFRNSTLRVGHDLPSSPITPQKPKGDYYRRRDTPVSAVHYPSAQYTKPNKRKAVPGAIPASNKPLLSDARAEHLLLAARKIGRDRASILSGTFANSQAPGESSPQSKRATALKPPLQPQPPKTPRRNATANTPLLTRTPLGQSSSAVTQPRTPLQSLLSAAQSVLSAPGDPSTSIVESPVAKRRKIDTSVSVVKSADTPQTVRKERERGQLPGGVARVRSALDFLADQAEAYSVQAPSQESVSSEPKESEETRARDAELGEVPQGDMEMDEADQDITNEINSSVVDKGKGKEKVGDPSLSSRAGTPIESQPQPTQSTQPNSRSSTPASASLGSTKVASFPVDQKVPSQEQLSQPQMELVPRNPTRASAPLETLPSSLTLAPAIDLTPRASHSPAPQATNTDQQSIPRKRSRSPSTERPLPRALSMPLIDNGSSSFTVFSLQRPKTLTPVSGGEPSGLVPELVTGRQTQGNDQETPERASPKVSEGIKFISDLAPRRTRSPYIKWTKEEDEQLAKAVAKYGQKWDLVQKALPSRGYHQVRQRWLRKLGMFDGSKIDLSSVETNAAAEFLNISTAPPADSEMPLSELQLRANPKLGLAPLDSEKVLGGSSNSSDGMGRSLSPFSTSAGTFGGFPFPSDAMDPHTEQSNSWPIGGYEEGG